MSLPEIVACRCCGTAIRWIRSASTGQPAPIEVLPSGLGNIAITADGTYRVVPARATEAGALYMNHRVTCTMAARPPFRHRSPTPTGGRA